MNGNGDVLLRAAREAIDPAALQAMLEEVYGEEFDEEVALALREAAAEEVALSVLDAADRARRRARAPEAADVAESVERRRGACGCEEPYWEFKFGVWESK